MIDYNVRGNEINIIVRSKHCKTAAHHSCLSLSANANPKCLKRSCEVSVPLEWARKKASRFRCVYRNWLAGLGQYTFPTPFDIGTDRKCGMSAIQSYHLIFKYLMSAGLRANHTVPFTRCYCKQLWSSASHDPNAGR